MYESFCYDERNNVIEHFWQWDSDRTITVRDINTASTTATVQFHFSNRLSESASKVTVSINDGEASATVPNYLFSQPYPIQVYIYEGTSEDEETTADTVDAIVGKTIWAAEIPVRARPRPESIEYAEIINHVDELKELVDTAEILASRLETRFEEVEDSIEELEKALDDFNTETETLITNINIRKEALQDEIDGIFDIANADKDTLQDEVNSIITAANTAKDNLNDRIVEANNTLNALKEENNRAETNISNLDKENDRAEENIDTLNQKNSEADENIVSLTEKNISAETNISNLDKENDRAEGNINTLDKENDRAEENISNLNNTNDRADALLSEYGGIQSDYLEINPDSLNFIRNKPLGEIAVYHPELEVPEYTGDEVDTDEIIVGDDYGTSLFCKFIKVADLKYGGGNVSARSVISQLSSVVVGGFDVNKEELLQLKQHFEDYSVCDGLEYGNFAVLATDKANVIHTFNHFGDVYNFEFPEAGLYVYYQKYDSSSQDYRTTKKLCFDPFIKKLDNEFLNIDSTVEQNSNNPVSSDAVSRYVDDKLDDQVDYTENDTKSPRFIRNKPFGEVSIYNGLLEVPEYTGSEVCANQYKPDDNTYVRKFVKVADLEYDQETVLSQLTRFKLESGDICTISPDKKKYISGYYSLCVDGDLQFAVCDKPTTIYITGAEGATVDRAYNAPEAGLYLYYEENTEQNTSYYPVKELYFDSYIEKLDNKFLHIDEAPTQDSDNLISSGAVFNAISNIEVSGGQVQSDYDVNDAEDLAYIKNRPFYDYRKYEDIEGYGDSVFATISGWEYAVAGIRVVKKSDLPDKPSLIIDQIKSIGAGNDFDIENDAQSFGNGSYQINGDFLVDENDVGIAFDGLLRENNTITFPESGFYYFTTINNVSRPVYIEFKGDYKPLDSRYLKIDVVPKKDSANLVRSGYIYEIDQEVKKHKSAVEAGVDYAENDSQSTTYIKNRPFYEEEVCEGNELTIPEYTGEEVCTNVWDDILNSSRRIRYIKIDDLRHDVFDVISNITKVVKSDSTEVKSFYIQKIYQSDQIVCCSASADNGLEIVAVSKPCRYHGDEIIFPERGLYLRIAQDIVYDSWNQTIDEEKTSPIVQPYNKIYFNNVVYPLNVKFLPEEFTALQNDVKTTQNDIKNVQSDIQKIEQTVGTEEVMRCVTELSQPSGTERVVALTDEWFEVGFMQYCDIDIKTRDELSEPSGFAMLKNVQNKSLRNLNLSSYIDNIYKYLPQDYVNSGELGKVKIGIGIFDKQFQNGIKIIFTDISSDIGAHIEVTKVADGRDIETYYGIDTNYTPHLSTNWYKLKNGSYVTVVSEIMALKLIDFDEAYIVDYWVTESEENYKNAKQSELIINYPKAVAHAIASAFMTYTLSEGLYKDITDADDNDVWVKWMELPDSSEANTIQQIDTMPMFAEEGKIVALKADTTHHDYHFFHDCKFKNRSELTMQNDDGSSFIDLTNATLINKTVHIGALPELERHYVSNWLWNMWEIELEKKRQEGTDILNDPVYKGEAPDIGVCIYDKSWQNGIKIRYHLFLEDEGDEYIRVTKMVNGIDTEDYFYFAEGSISVEKYPYTQEEGWYKLVDGNYVMLAAEELPNFNLNFDQAYIVDYWAMADEEEYNAVMNAGYSVGLPTALSSFIKKFVCVVSELKQGFYKYTNSEWVKWSAASEFSGSYNDLKDKPEIPSVEGFATTEYVNQLLDSFAAMLDAANREVI